MFDSLKKEKSLQNYFLSLWTICCFPPTCQVMVALDFMSAGSLSVGPQLQALDRRVPQCIRTATSGSLMTGANMWLSELHLLLIVECWDNIVCHVCFQIFPCIALLLQLLAKVLSLWIDGSPAVHLIGRSQVFFCFHCNVADWGKDQTDLLPLPCGLVIGAVHSTEALDLSARGARAFGCWRNSWLPVFRWNALLLEQERPWERRSACGVRRVAVWSSPAPRSWDLDNC